MTNHARMYRRGRRVHRLREFYFEWVFGPWMWGTFPIREPRLWWFCRRLELHRWFGLPMPKLPPYKIAV